jgi:hypothetical protein
MPGGVRAEAIPPPDAQYARALSDVAEPLDQGFAKILGRSKIDRYIQSEDKSKLAMLRERITNITAVNQFASVLVLASEGVRVQQQVLRHLLFNVFLISRSTHPQMARNNPIIKTETDDIDTINCGAAAD